MFYHFTGARAVGQPASSRKDVSWQSALRYGDSGVAANVAGGCPHIDAMFCLKHYIRLNRIVFNEDPL